MVSIKDTYLIHSTKKLWGIIVTKVQQVHRKSIYLWPVGALVFFVLVIAVFAIWHGHHSDAHRLSSLTLQGGALKSAAAATTQNSSTPADSSPTNDAKKTEVQSGSSNDVQVSTSQQNGSATTVNINGQSVAVPPNGSLHKTITSNNGTTHVDFNSTNNSTETKSHSSTSIHVESNTHITSGGN